MKKAKISFLLLTILIVSITCLHVLGENKEPESPGPAPNSGDCVSDGCGFDRNNWPNDNNPGDGKGPAPYSGDGVPDGSGF